MAGIAASLAMQLLLPALLGGNGRGRSSHPIVVGTGRRKRRRGQRRRYHSHRDTRGRFCSAISGRGQTGFFEAWRKAFDW